MAICATSIYSFMKPISRGMYALSFLDDDMDKQLYESIPKYKFTMRQGDVLFLPPWTWHQIRLSNINTIPFTMSYSLRGFDITSNTKQFWFYY